jgi:hypothetical protein
MDINTNSNGSTPINTSIPIVVEGPPKQGGAFNKILIVLITLLFIVLAYMIYIIVQKSIVERASLNLATPTPSNSGPTPTSAPKTEEEELNEIVIKDVESDLQDIKTDLQGL